MRFKAGKVLTFTAISKNTREKAGHFTRKKVEPSKKNRLKQTIGCVCNSSFYHCCYQK